jgi:hypothetical protein
MKRLGLIFAALIMSLSASFAQDWNKSTEPFQVNFNKLNTYLELTPSQVHDVYAINELFIQNQKESLATNSSSRKEEMLRRTVYGNLSQMKSVLNKEQYRKYVTLLNVTNNNKGFVIGKPSLAEEMYLADKND